MTLSQASFEFVRAVLKQRSGHCLEDDKGYLVEARLLPVARRHGFESIEALVLRLRGRSDERLLVEMVEAMTIHESFFFRDGRPFEVLLDVVLPEFVRNRADVRRLNIWSAACSTGQEPYSVALLIRQHFPELLGWDIHLIASDLSAVALERARAGRYSDLEVSRGLSPELLSTYFERQSGGWQIRDDIRRMVEFRSINLAAGWSGLPLLDLVLLRNVLIYFDVPTRKRILGWVGRHLRPDGYLLLGGAETTYNVDDDFVPVVFEDVGFFKKR
jgi:chemotaxis protein methyltransferase CheR